MPVSPRAVSPQLKVDLISLPPPPAKKRVDSLRLNVSSAEGFPYDLESNIWLIKTTTGPFLI